jgi:hypothetical protein
MIVMIIKQQLRRISEEVLTDFKVGTSTYLNRLRKITRTSVRIGVTAEIRTEYKANYYTATFDTTCIIHDLKGPSSCRNTCLDKLRETAKHVTG